PREGQHYVEYLPRYKGREEEHESPPGDTLDHNSWSSICLKSRASLFRHSRFHHEFGRTGSYHPSMAMPQYAHVSVLGMLLLHPLIDDPGRFVVPLGESREQHLAV